MMRPLRLTASILSIDPAQMDDAIASLGSHADAIQLDIMDGIFVSNKTYGAEVLSNFRTPLPLDVHLMVADPSRRIGEFLAVPVQHITFHAETVPDSADRTALIAAIRKGGATAGVALKPATPLEAIDDVVEGVDLVLLMSVEPGLGGQEFIGSTLSKIEALRRAHPGLMIQVDGGINAETAAACIAAGADNLVIGSALFKAGDPGAFLDSIRDAAA